ncbi:hypothetical protein JL722_534 [Aureococcus anophagefferens]|nr:hypothetical protein JL722_534 [Aureococcus anophagefferens]
MILIDLSLPPARAAPMGGPCWEAALRVEFAAELALWKWRKGARVEFKRRRLAKETEGGDAAAAEKSAD